MKSYRPLLFVVGTLLLLIAAAALISNRSSLAQESTPEATPPPEQTVEVTTEVIPLTATPLPAYALASAMPLPVIPAIATSTLAPIELTATSQILSQIVPLELRSPGEIVVITSEATFQPQVLPVDYRVIYFIIMNSVEDSNITATTNLLRYMPGVEVAYNWEDVIRLDNEIPIQAIIIHSSAYEFVDRT